MTLWWGDPPRFVCRLASMGVLPNCGAGGAVPIYRALPGLASPVDLEGGTSCGSQIQTPRQIRTHVIGLKVRAGSFALSYMG